MLDFPFGLILLGKVGASLGGAGFADRDGVAGIALYDPQGAREHKTVSHNIELLSEYFAEQRSKNAAG